MKSALFFHLYLTLQLIIINSAASKVILLNDENFQSQMPTHTVLFVKFYMPWCDHCKKFEPEFARASDIIESKQLPVAFAEVNCDGSGRVTCSLYDIKGYPTIKVFNFGEFVFNYDGPKSSDSLVKFVRLKVEPGSQELKNLEDLSACLAGLDNVVIGFFHEQGLPIEKEFHRLAEALKEEYKFAHTFSNRVMMMFGYRNDIVLFRSEKLKTTLEQGQLKFEDQPTLYNLRNWVTSNYQGLAGFRTQKNIEHFKAPLVVAYFDVDLEDKSSLSAYYRNRVIMAARKFGPTKNREKINFAISDLREFKRELEEFGVKVIPEGQEKIIVTMRDSEQRRFIMDKSFSSEALEQFVLDVLSRKLDPYIKSESLPKTGEAKKSHIVTAVGTTFEKLVLDENKDVLVQLFAPWSSDCKSATEILEKVAKKLHNETEVRVVKVDATVNHLPFPYVIRGYPTVYLAKKNFKSKPLLYEGEQRVNGYLRFVAENSTMPLKNYDRSGKKMEDKEKEPVLKKVEL